MQLPSPVPPRSSRRYRPSSARSRRMLMVGAVLTAAAITGSIVLVASGRGAQCANSTFASGLWGASVKISMLGILLLPLFFLALFVYVGTKVAPRSRRENQPRASRNWSSVPLLAMGIFGALAIGSYANEFESYYCLTPAEIIIRPGILHNRIHLAWDDVEAVSAWCWTATPRGGPSYLGASLRLSFDNGEQLTVGLVSGGRVLMQDYVSIRQALHGKNYAYHAEATVSPGSCPTELYPVLQSWR
jgi:hypothetical protein